MDTKSFRSWLCQLGELSGRLREPLKRRLFGSEANDDARDWISRRAQEGLACPHCQAAHVQRWGRESGIQRYRCCDCRRTFNSLTGSPPAGLKCREAWVDYTQAMIDGCSLRAAARHALYIEARRRHPARWSRHTRNWSPIGAVTLNPERESVVATATDGANRQPLAARLRRQLS